MPEQTKENFLSEEYSISNNLSDVSETLYYKQVHISETDELQENIQEHGPDKVPCENLAETKLEESSSLCNLTRLRSSFSPDCLKNYKLKDTLDLLRCSSLGKNENLHLKKLPIESYMRHFKLSFEAKQPDPDSETPYFSSSCVQIPFTIELTDKTHTNMSPLISISDSRCGTLQKRYRNTVEISFEKASNISPPDDSKASEEKNVSSEIQQIADINVKEAETKSLIQVLVAIDFGTTYSGYAYAYMNSPGEIHLMKKWSDGEAGFTNFKIPSTILLDPTGEFHSFGYQAIEFYNDLEAGEAKDWSFFEKFKMSLHNSQVNAESIYFCYKNKRYKCIGFVFFL